MTSRDYCQLMAERGRLLALFDGAMPVGYLTYHLCPTVESTLSYIQRDMRLPPLLDYPEGSIIYIEQLEGLAWSRPLLRQVRELLTQRHPNWTKGIWYRLHRGQWTRHTLCREGGYYVSHVFSPCCLAV